MNCSVCGQEISIWTKLTHSKQSECGKCHDEGTGQLRALVQAAGSASTLNIQHEIGWMSQFDAAVGKYHLFGNDVAGQRNSLLGHVFKLVEMEDTITDEALTFVSGIIEKYNLRKDGTPELRDAYLQVGMRERIQLFERGSAPTQLCNGLVLHKGEVCHWEEGASLRVLKTKREYVGTSNSFSIPLGHGFRYRVGGFRGHSIDHTSYEDAGAGVLHITNQRLCFNGVHTIAIAYKQMLAVNGFEGGFIVQTSNEKKPGIFIVRHPELTAQMLLMASNPPADQAKQQKRGKSVPTPSS
jgi:hypothetical protein